MVLKTKKYGYELIFERRVKKETYTNTRFSQLKIIEINGVKNEWCMSQL